MTRNHLTAAELAGYRERRLSAEDLLEASDHLAGCEECRAGLLDLVKSHPANVPGEARTEFSYEELAGWLDNELDPLTRREVAEALASSPQTRAELSDLAALRDEMNALAARDHAKEAVPAQAIERGFPQWAFPLAAAVVLSGAAMWWGMGRTRDTADFVKLRDGDRVIAFAADGRSRILAKLPQGIGDSIAETIRTGRIDIAADIAALAGQRGTLAGAGDEEIGLRALEPIGTAVREARPRFRWRSAPEASGYNINVIEETSGALVVSQQLPPDATEWQPAEALPAGEVYQWEVQALRDGVVMSNSPRPPEPEARFQILSAAKVAELEEAQRASNGSHFVMGVANARAGLLDDAVREFRTLSEQNPNSDLLRQLIDQLEAQRKPRG